VNQSVKKKHPMADSLQDSSPPQLLNRIGAILDNQGVNWATIGALAVAYHGPVRASLDADALISLKGASLDLEGLAKILSAEGLSVETRMGEEGDPLGFVLRIYDRDRNQVDLIGGIRRLEPDFFKRALVDEFDGLKLRIASPEDLIALKLFAGGPQDIEDARGVLTIQSAGIDKDLVLSLCRRFGADVEIRSRKLLGM
jgi:hypothetical protein